MSIQYTVYNTSTGAIIRTGTALTEVQARLQGNTPGTNVTIIGSDPATQIIDTTPTTGDPGTKNRLPMVVNGVQISATKSTIVADGTDSFTISPIPSGAIYVVDVPSGVGIASIPSATITDGSLIVTTTVAGIYKVTIKYSTFLDFAWSFNAT